MAINFRKLKSQIKPFAPEAKHTGYIFLATDEQKNRGIDTVASPRNKNQFLKLMVLFINEYDEYKEEFTL